MNFIDTVKIANANRHLLGKKWKGVTIDKIIIASTEQILRAEFEKKYKEMVGKDVTPQSNDCLGTFVLLIIGGVTLIGVPCYGLFQLLI